MPKTREETIVDMKKETARKVETFETKVKENIRQKALRKLAGMVNTISSDRHISANDKLYKIKDLLKELEADW